MEHTVRDLLNKLDAHQAEELEEDVLTLRLILSHLFGMMATDAPAPGTPATSWASDGKWSQEFAILWAAEPVPSLRAIYAILSNGSPSRALVEACTAFSEFMADQPVSVSQVSMDGSRAWVWATDMEGRTGCFPLADQAFSKAYQRWQSGAEIEGDLEMALNDAYRAFSGLL